ncbi:isoamylase early set domain-containing protein [Nonomuraea africana]|uniref:1,4-alpha-glucan branching enzyme n=1 Tax=Nonomuraea africana TaxID=46171 RepID=A0ABR9KB33_9ACTN|nr:isoamylase early set domain-containing protein [Nonomuraea africana]MBE1559217.1 1,4-alpha-glucan branching enzyme [Nonomuraea africana]
MIRKDMPTEDGLANLTFTLPADIPGRISVVGDFNHWDPYAHPMTRTEQGAHTAVVPLPQGTSICFRYLAEGGVWLDEPDADDRDERGSIVHVPATDSRDRQPTSDGAPINASVKTPA